MALKYMVALDGSNGAEMAFRTTLALINNQRGDELYLVAAVEPLPFEFVSKIQELNKSCIDFYKEILLDYGARCREAKVKYHLILTKGSHIGASICHAVGKKYIDFLVLGRRGLNPFQRLLMGSTSKYCMEHADANVLIIKGSFLPEEHSSLRKVVEQEEIERKRRILEEKGTSEMMEKRRKEAELIGTVIEEEEERKRRIKERYGDEIEREEEALEEKKRREAELIGVVIEEENERKRRMKEVDEEEAKRRIAAHIGAVIDEEQERKRRIQDERIIDERTHHVQVVELED